MDQNLSISYKKSTTKKLQQIVIVLKLLQQFKYKFLLFEVYPPKYLKIEYMFDQ